MRKFLLVFLLFAVSFCIRGFGGDNKGLQQVYWKKVPPVLTFGALAQYLDGTIAGNEFVDKSGFGRNADIIGKDIELLSGFPYKSKAMIAQKASSFGVIPDVDHFWFQPNGTPNQIPVVSLFQDIDYAHQIFCRHIPQVLDANGVEVREASVVDICTYLAPLSGPDLLHAQNYFLVPGKLAGAVYVARNGNDTTGTGSELLPYRSMSKAENTVPPGTTVYVKTGIYTENGGLNNLYLHSNKYWISTGRCEIRQTNESQVILLSTNEFCTLNGFYINAQGRANCVKFFADAANKTLKRCYFTGAVSAELFSQAVLTTKNVIDQSVIYTVASYGVVFESPFDLNNTLLNGSGTIDMVVTSMTGGIGTFSMNHCKFISSITGRSVAIESAGQFDVRIADNTFQISTGRGVVLQNQRSADIAYNRFDVSSNGRDPVVVGTQSVNMSKCWIKNNYISIKSLISYGIAVGAEISSNGDNKIGDIQIMGNKVLGPAYFDPAVYSGLILHSIFVGFQKSALIQYNYVNGCGIGPAKKGNPVIDSMGGILYNVSVNNVSGIVCKGVRGVPIYGNTVVNTLFNAAKGWNGLRLIDSLASGTFVNTKVRNNIIINKLPNNPSFGAIYLDNTSSQHLVSNNNCLYAPDNLVRKEGWGTYSFAQWQAQGFDLNSVNSNLAFHSVPNEQFWLDTPVYIGSTLGPNYEDGLDVSTVFGFSIVTKLQTIPWQIGAYVK